MFLQKFVGFEGLGVYARVRLTGTVGGGRSRWMWTKSWSVMTVFMRFPLVCLADPPLITHALQKVLREYLD